MRNTSYRELWGNVSLDMGCKHYANEVHGYAPGSIAAHL